MGRANIFTQDELNFIRENLTKMPVKEIAAALGRHLNSVYGKIREWEIRKDARATVNATALPEEGTFLIMREEACLAVCPEIKFSQWRKIEMPENIQDPSTIASLKRADEEIIPEHVAKQIIKAKHMTCVHKHPKGEIYEMPGSPFFQHYQGFYKKVEEAKRAARRETLAKTMEQKKLGGARPGAGRKPKMKKEA